MNTSQWKDKLLTIALLYPSYGRADRLKTP